MRKILTSMMILLALLVIVGCNGDKNGDKEPADVKLEGVTVSFQGVEVNKDFEIVDFYLQRNTDFNLHIYLENELDLDITKIKINNTEYTSDDFLEGSSNTFITLSFNTQNNTGKNDYKINGITYLKASDERQADIEDNDLVSIYVQSRFIPVANVSNINADVLSINLNIAISDREGLIDMQNGDAVFLLFEEGVEILSEQLTYNNEIELVNLKPDQQYTYKIQAIFDESDGEGLNERVLLEGNLKTIQPINVRVHAPVETEISFDYSVLNESITIDKIDLELDGEFEKNIPIQSTLVSGLTPGLIYEIVFYYQFEFEGELFNKTQRVEAETFKLIITDLIRNGTTVPFAPEGGVVQIPNYQRKDEELRAIWFSTVSNIDIPTIQPGELGLEMYKDTIRLAFDNIQAANMNAVFFQIRPMNDAWYESDLAPWSRYITGTEGKDPGFDVLAFALEEAHARGIELHGWLNPYRVATSHAGLSAMHPTNFAYGREDLWLQGTTSAGALQTILDPGIPEVQTYIRDVIKEIIENYPTINGIHFDDYFYLDTSMIGANENSPDYQTYLTYRENSSQTITNFRRESVTTIIRDIFNDVESFNSQNDTHIKFGISPSGIWDNIGSNPEGSHTTGWSHLRALNADTKAWIEEEIIHYIIPQIYWDFNLTAARYANLVDWWSKTVRGHNVDLIIGMGPYRLRDTGWLEVELADQLRFNQMYDEVVGASFFTYQDLVALSPDRLVNAMNIIKNEFWTNEARVPWETNIYDDDGGDNGNTELTSVNLEGISISHDGLEDDKDFENRDYFLHGNQEYTINIHLENDLNLIVTSLKINDTIYTLGDFDQGSTTRLIKLTFNTNDMGNNPYGEFDFKVSDITFLEDGVEQIVNIVVNDTVTTTVSPQLKPIASMVSEEAFTDKYNLEVNITDLENLISIADGNIVFTLYEGGEVVYSKELELGNNIINLENLKVNQTYTYDIKTSFDMLDGNGLITEAIFEDSLTTNEPFNVSLGSEEMSQITFDYEKVRTDLNLIKIDLEYNGNVLKSVDLNDKTVTGLTQGTNYTLAFHYSYIFNGETYTGVQRVKASTLKVTMTNIIRNGSTVPFAPEGGVVQVPTYIEKEEELRAIWFSTVSNIDIARMPNGQGGIEIFKGYIRTMLNNVKAANMNAVFFQIRPMNDAWYESDLAPWSRYITGTEGQDPGFDVLAFALEEAHARGIELHGWLNPYRVANSATSLNAMHPTNFAYGREDLWLQGTTSAGALQTILDPGIPEVQTYIRDVIKEIIENYPTINGIHFDDYFYLDNAIIGTDSNSPDYQTYLTHRINSSQTFTNFRRESVTTIIRGIFNDVESFNSQNNTHIKFGISPSGIWDNIGSNPEGSHTTGWSHLRALNADTKAWIEEEIIHYIIPQIYWDFTLTAARYANLVDWWSKTVRGHNVDLIIGMGPYRLRGDTTWHIEELADQLRFNQLYNEVVGSSFFTYQDLKNANGNTPLAQAMNIVINDLWTNEVTVPWETNIYN